MAAGYLGDRFSNRAGLMIAISLLLMGGGMMLAGFAPTYVTMLVAMFLVGIGRRCSTHRPLGELSRRFRTAAGSPYRCTAWLRTWAMYSEPPRSRRY